MCQEMHMCVDLVIYFGSTSFSKIKLVAHFKCTARVHVFAEKVIQYNNCYECRKLYFQGIHKNIRTVIVEYFQCYSILQPKNLRVIHILHAGVKKCDRHVYKPLRMQSIVSERQLLQCQTYLHDVLKRVLYTKTYLYICFTFI